MSMIHSSWALVGCSSRLIDGTARCSTVRSITYSRHASVNTPSPIHSRRPACRGLLIMPGDLLLDVASKTARAPKTHRSCRHVDCHSEPFAPLEDRLREESRGHVARFCGTL